MPIKDRLHRAVDGKQIGAHLVDRCTDAGHKLERRLEQIGADSPPGQRRTGLIGDAGREPLGSGCLPIDDGDLVLDTHSAELALGEYHGWVTAPRPITEQLHPTSCNGLGRPISKRTSGAGYLSC